MHKKLAGDLTSLAHSILQMKNKEDVFALKNMAYKVYEKLSVLAFVEEYINTTSNTTISKEDIMAKIAAVSENEQVVEKNKELLDEVEKEALNTSAKDIKQPDDTLKNDFTEQPLNEIQQLFEINDDVKNDARDVGERKTQTLEDELQGTISVDSMVDLFEKKNSQTSLNNRLQNTIEIGLNDRIAFVKHLFDDSQEDFNRVLSQLNTFKTAKEAKKFITKIIKPDYNWSEKETYENRFLEIIERRFL
ncbi:hypothetical protein [Tenacibaculum sp. UWU-22]|uniref:hypothetical protein n=1 Tax=Tenacibaculum sp. UWU-22 TaxID=3234187 RepID=UPI0034DADF66